jgi:AbrB family looped-hinge helix DNA binding protein
MKERIEDIVKVSPKGQIVIPKTIRERLSIAAGERLLVTSKDRDIYLKKLERLSMEDIAEKVEGAARKRGVDVDNLISEAIEWARKLK